LEEQTNEYTRLAKEKGPERVKQTVCDYLLKYQKERSKMGLIAPSTLGNYCSSLKKFFEVKEDEGWLQGVKITGES